MGKTKNQPFGRGAQYQPPSLPAHAYRANYRGPAPPPMPVPPQAAAPPAAATAAGRNPPPGGNRRGRPCLQNSQRANSTTFETDLTRLLTRTIKKNGRLMPTENNGFTRSLKPDQILCGFTTDDSPPLFVVRFKTRKVPEIITLHEARRKASALLVDYYCSILVNAVPRAE